LRKIKKRFAELGINTREDCKRLVAEDWKSSMNIKAEGEEVNTEVITNV